MDYQKLIKLVDEYSPGARITAALTKRWPYLKQQAVFGAVTDALRGCTAGVYMVHDIAFCAWRNGYPICLADAEKILQKLDTDGYFTSEEIDRAVDEWWSNTQPSIHTMRECEHDQLLGRFALMDKTLGKITGIITGSLWDAFEQAEVLVAPGNMMQILGVPFGPSYDDEDNENPDTAQVVIWETRIS